jgi:hypothetical protein
MMSNNVNVEREGGGLAAPYDREGNAVRGGNCEGEMPKEGCGVASKVQRRWETDATSFPCIEKMEKKNTHRAGVLRSIRAIGGELLLVVNVLTPRIGLTACSQYAVPAPATA